MKQAQDAGMPTRQPERNMYDHHRNAIQRLTDRFMQDEDVLAVMVGGSIAHGYATERSDVDIIIVLEESAYQKKKAENALLYYSEEFSDYPGCYVDGKYIGIPYLRLLKQKGSEASRYALKDCMVLFSRSEEVTQLVREAAQFNTDKKERNARRFLAQLYAWKWYYYEGIGHGNSFLVQTAVTNFIFYACRVILNHNEMLYPYHKWLIAEVRKAERKPEHFVQNMERLMESRNGALIEQLTADIKAMHTCDLGDWDWPALLHEDVETVWMLHEPGIADI